MDFRERCKTVKVNDKAMKTIIEGYTREAGVRTLERTIAKVVRKATVEMLDEKAESVTVNAEKLNKYLGAVRYTREALEKSYIKEEYLEHWQTRSVTRSPPWELFWKTPEKELNGTGNKGHCFPESGVSGRCCV